MVVFDKLFYFKQPLIKYQNFKIKKINIASSMFKKLNGSKVLVGKNTQIFYDIAQKTLYLFMVKF